MPLMAMKMRELINAYKNGLRPFYLKFFSLRVHQSPLFDINFLSLHAIQQKCKSSPDDRR